MLFDTVKIQKHESVYNTAEDNSRTGKDIIASEDIC